MMEKAVTPFTMAVTLTYGSDTQEQHDAAKVFHYRHISSFLKLLRKRAFDLTGQNGQIRFIACGELGSKKGRCHWHLVLFSQVNLTKLGEFKQFPSGQVVAEEAEIISVDRKRRLHWDAWPYGFVVIQEPDQDGIEYALKYAVKDQFGMEKSKATMRETKAEAYAAGYFRASRNPPIGQPFLDKKLAEWLQELVLPVSLQVNVPEYRGYWYPVGALRKRLLSGLHFINESCKVKRGKQAPQARALRATLVDNENDLERFEHGTNDKEEPEDDFEQNRRIKRADAIEAIKREEGRRIRASCAGLAVCEACAANLPEKEFERYQKGVSKAARDCGGFGNADAAFRRRKVPNPFCALGATQRRIQAAQKTT